MSALSRYALPGIIVLSGLGALLMALLVARYGFPTGDEDAEQANNRILFTRVGHALAAVCFATSVMLAVVALSARTPSPPAPVVPPADTEPLTRLDADVRRLEERLNRELAALEERLGDMETARSVGGPPAPAARAAPADEAVSALPGEPQPQVRATVQNVRVDVRSHRRGNGVDWTVRLTDPAGRPLSGADVTLHGRTVGGAAVEVALDGAAEPGTYRGRLSGPGREAGDLRLRVVRYDKRFDLPLAQGVSW